MERVNRVEDGVAIGSGYTYRSIMAGLHRTRAAAFKEQLSAMIRPAGRGGFSKKQVEDMTAGYEDGFRSAIMSLIEMGIIKVDESK